MMTVSLRRNFGLFAAALLLALLVSLSGCGKKGPVRPIGSPPPESPANDCCN